MIDHRVVLLDGDVESTDTTVSVPRAGNDALVDIGAGAILVSKTGDGLLRKVTASHVGERIVFDTVQASIEDAVIDGSVSDQLVISDGGKTDEFGIGRIDYAVDDKTLWQNDRFSIVLDHGAIHARPSLDLELSLKDRKLDEFSAVLGGTLDAELDVSLNVNESTLNPTIPLWKSSPAIYYQQIGWVPVLETVQMTVGVRFETTARGEALAHLHGNAHVELGGGIEWDGDRFRPVSHFEKEITGELATGVRLDQLDVRAYLFAQVDVKFYGVVGPYVNAGPYVEKDRAGFHAEVGGSLGAFGVKLPAMPRYTLFDQSTPL